MQEGMSNGNTDDEDPTQDMSIGSQDNRQRIDAILSFGISHGVTGYHGARKVRDEFIREYGKDQYEEFLQRIIWNSNAEIALDDFINFPSIKNNFYLYFIDNFLGDMYRSEEIYKRFAHEKPEINTELLLIYKNRHQFTPEEPSDIKKLHEAYRIMRTYPEFSINHDLFK